MRGSDATPDAPQLPSERRRLTIDRTRAAAAGLACAVLLLACNAVLGYGSIASFAERARLVQQSLGVVQEIERVRALVLEAGNAALAYLRDGGEPLLDSREALVSRLDSETTVLRELTAHDSDQQRRVDLLSSLVLDRRELLHGAIELRRRGEPGRAIGAIAGTIAATDRIQRVADEMRAAEVELLAARTRASERSETRALRTLVVGSALSLALFLAAFWLLAREMRARDRIQDALRSSAAEIEDLYNRAPCGYHSLDANGVFVRVNDTELGWLGYSRDEVVGKLSFLDVCTAESGETVRRNFPSFLERGEVRDLEFDLVRKDGGVLPVSLSATAIRDAQGRYRMSRSALFDIGERRRAERDRDRIFTLSRDLLCIAGADGRFERVNPAWERVLGFSERELTSVPFLELVHPDDREPTLAAFETQIERGETILSFENRYRCRDGTYRTLLWNSTPLREEGRVFATAHDITDRKRDEESLRMAMRASEAANRELEAFSYSVSHDLRAPLRAIDGFSQILEEEYGEKIDEEARRLIRVLRDNTVRMGRLIDDLLAFSRLGRAKLVATRVDMTALASEVLSEVVAASESRPRCTVQVLPACQGDPALLRQVFANLLSNAVKFSSRVVEPTIEVGGRSDEGEVVYWVRDNGAGFDMRFADKLFGVFQRLHRQDEFPGTGVGLAIVERVVARHGGRVWAEAAPGAGAAFHFALQKAEVDT